ASTAQVEDPKETRLANLTAENRALRDRLVAATQEVSRLTSRADDLAHQNQDIREQLAKEKSPTHGQPDLPVLRAFAEKLAQRIKQSDIEQSQKDKKRIDPDNNLATEIDFHLDNVDYRKTDSLITPVVG